ncbi:DegT/DnrJ/EryC1/StrS family aminotransferase [Marinicella litoralis]|uniref:dTDP-4-amino-4,6-dideoxygalactose transaminase n=1 Tax=Marinicella litoralis TaxID=644220 RepID=A0A4R6XVB9_9GAMM|nr:DegT/DnrJ/EryC1/StrS family aminotransferase [Marinicella litoralis]TDR23776.1 dTDP-4-amino-4,6-dideoxygalactose transaminase [Marinicella litoralis]
MRIRFFDFSKENKSYLEAVLTSVVDTIKSGQYILGPKVKQFEAAFAEYLGAKYCLGVGNGLDAIKIILLALGVDENSEVIVPAHTFIASWLPVTDLGATLVPVEPDEQSMNIDINLIEAAITENTKAIIPVHLYGKPVAMNRLKALGLKHGIPIVEDAAQAHGAVYQDKHCGTWGVAAAFSFYPTKNLGACGDAGAVITNDSELYKKMKLIRNYGSNNKYNHECFGLNSRLDEIQAGILFEKIKHLDALITQRKEIAEYYGKNINSTWLTTPIFDNSHVWHQYVLRVKERNAFIEHMENCGVETMIHYPIPPHQSGAYKNNFATSEFPITNRLCDEVVSLPIYPGLSATEVAHVVDSCNQYKAAC